MRISDWSSDVCSSDLAQEQLRRAGDIYMAAGSVICCWGMGITQHKHSVATIQMLVNLLLLRGNLGRPGAGACPVRGHSNVQGDRTMRSEEHTSELQSLMRISYAVFCLQKKTTNAQQQPNSVLTD